MKIKKIAKRLLQIVVTLIVFIVVSIFMIKYFNPSIGRPPQAEKINSPNFDGKVFINPVPTSAGSLGDMPGIMKDYISRKEESAPDSSYLFSESGERDSLGNGTTHVNWLGHAAVLIENSGKYVLLDPMLGERASPFSFMGPKRYHPSPIAPKDLPEIEAVIISHDHYDHLDYETIQLIHPKVKIFLVPLGIGATLKYWGVPEVKIKEMDWHDTHKSGQFEFIATPARHFSGRFLTRNNTLWASWVINIGEEKIYFGGDTGIFNGFADIGKQYGPFDLSLLPIGAYNEAWHDIHMNPEEAIDAFGQLDRGLFIPIHWGTFDLALHSWYEPVKQLVDSEDLANEELITPRPGEWIDYRTYQSDHLWWKPYSKELSKD
ncbi:MAG: MBL fold metallo-hydrolase [Cyclobacteriaceae bacterium]